MLLVLYFNIMFFDNRYFHYIKENDLGTPITVNFEYLLMKKFEKEMLSN